MIGGTGGTESYLEIGNMELLQLGKYQPLNYEIVEDNNEITEYRITKIRDVNKESVFEAKELKGNRAIISTISKP